MSDKKWYEQIPENGVLVTDESSCVHLVGYVDGDIAMTPVSDTVIFGSVIDYVSCLTPITAQGWWDLAPWQPMSTAPCDVDILIMFDDGHITEIMFESGTEPAEPRCKKWLPLPELNHDANT